MKKKYIIFTFIFVLILIPSIPATNLLYTKFREDADETPTPTGYVDDASHLNKTKVAKEVDVAINKGNMLKQLSELIKTAKLGQQKISIAGARHSMGGHTIYPGGISLNMLPYNRMNYNEKNNVLTVGSGAMWSDIVGYLNQYGKSVKVMQSVSNFSVGGSMSVNGHGWQKNVPPISSSVISFTLMNHEGEIITCSREENEELFSLVIGGYGMFGIILDVNLQVVDNTALQYKNYILPANEYVDYYKNHVTNNAKANLVYGRLNITANNFLNEATLNVYETIDDEIPLYDALKENELQRLVLRSSVGSEYGKKQRWILEKMNMWLLDKSIFSRNQIIHNDAKYIANKFSGSTDILHEYFIPKDKFNQFINAIKPVLQKSDIDLLNITIRAVNEDKDSFMRYAREDVFAFVFYFNQKTTPTGELKMKKLTEQLVDAAKNLQGTYYLPYRLHISRKKMREIYPQANDFFRLKRKYDPQELFNSKFYLHYNGAN